MENIWYLIGMSFMGLVSALYFSIKIKNLDYLRLYLIQGLLVLSGFCFLLTVFNKISYLEIVPLLVFVATTIFSLKLSFVKAHRSTGAILSSLVFFGSLLNYLVLPIN